MTEWLGMGADQFDRALGTARERKLAARLREQPDTLLDLPGPRFTVRGQVEQIEQLDGQCAMFGAETEE